MSSYDEDEEEPHMLAVATGDESLHGEENVLDPHEEMMMMQENEAVGSTIPPPPPTLPPPIQQDETDPAALAKPTTASANNNSAVDVSFESYIFDSDGDEDFQARGRSHVIPVINSSPTKKKRQGSPDNGTDPSTSPQTPNSAVGPPTNSDGQFFGRKSSQGSGYISSPSSTEYEPSPPPDPGTSSAFTSPKNQQSQSLPNFRYSSPVIQTPPAMKSSPALNQSAPASSYNGQPVPSGYSRQTTPPPTIPDGKTPIVLETPQGYQQSKNSNVEQHAFSRQSISPGGYFCCGMSKRAFCMAWFYILCATGCIVYFSVQYASTSDLRAQVDRLSNEVTRLEVQVDELDALIATLNSTVVELSDEVSTLEIENEKLAEQNTLLAEQNSVFGNQTADLQLQVETLQGTVSNLTLANEALKEEATKLELLNSELSNLTIALNETNTNLTAQVENLTAVNEELVTSNEALVNQTQELQASLGEVVAEFDAAYETVIELQDELAVLQAENDRLSNLTDSLEAILSFLEETNQDADLTVDELASQLEEQISNNRRLVLENLQNTMTQRTQTWNCDYTNTFSGSEFAEDFNVAIPNGSYLAVLDYVETRVLTDLCLDRLDFELYLSVNFMPNGNGLTSNELVSGVSMYTSDALNHYFPNSGEDGVSPEAWAEASYDCSNLPSELQYRSNL